MVVDLLTPRHIKRNNTPIVPLYSPEGSHSTQVILGSLAAIYGTLLKHVNRDQTKVSDL